MTCGLSGGYPGVMAGGAYGTEKAGAVTSGGWRGMNGAQRRVALLAAAGFLTIVCLVLVANAESSISDLRAVGSRIPDHLIWSWEWSSMIGWLSLCPALWWAVGKVRPPRFGWPIVAGLFLAGSVAASAWHVGVMVALRHAYYAATGEGPYRFFGVIGNRVAYEFRKDLVTFAQFVVVAAVVRWMIDRNADAPASAEPDRAADPPRHLVVADGAVKRSVPLREIESVAAAGNYVELSWGGRKMLHRATLSAVEAELGDLFVRVHRGLIVRVDAIRDVEVDRSGDFVATLESGARTRGSRRYRDGLKRWMGDVAG